MGVHGHLAAQALLPVPAAQVQRVHGTLRQHDGHRCELHGFSFASVLKAQNGKLGFYLEVNMTLHGVADKKEMTNELLAKHIGEYTKP
jgi:hypothetical protein